MVTEFFAWWGEQLSALVPDSVRWRVSGGHRRIVLDYARISLDHADTASGLVEAFVQDYADTGTLGTFALDANGLGLLRAAVGSVSQRPEATLRLGQGMVLEKHLVMPLAALRDLERIVEYELDHETPFTADEVYWSVAVVSRDRALGQITARLSLVLKRDVDSILSKLRDAGIAVSAMIGTEDDFQIPLGAKPGLTAIFDASLHARGMRELVAIIALLVIAAVVSPFARQSIELGNAASRIAALQSDADAAQVLRRQIGGDSGDRSDPQTAIGNPLEILAAVTDALPDDTYLSDFTEHHRDVELIGQSAAAAALIERLSNSPVLRDPSFSAPVTRDEGTGADDFAIKLGLRSP